MATKLLSSKHIRKLCRINNQHRIYVNKTKLTMYVKCSQSNFFSKFLKCNFSVNSVVDGSAGRAETTSTTQGLSKLQAQELVLRLNGEERTLLFSALQEYQSKLVKDEYEGVHSILDLAWMIVIELLLLLSLSQCFNAVTHRVDVCGYDVSSFIDLYHQLRQRALAESVPKPTTRNLMDIAIANSIPFVGFGFLDNFFMLIFGDYIDLYLGSYLCMTTMAAAALGNTFSDILGIGTAFYVERMANRIGYSPPKLSPVQMDMPVSRNFANLGRVLGVTIGCILGMCPLLFRSPKEEDEGKKKSVAEIQIVHQ